MELTLNAQTGVIGSLLLWPEELGGQIIHRLTPEDLPDPTLRNVFRAARELFLAGKPLDPVLISERLGPSFDSVLRQCMELVPTRVHWAEYCDQLRDNRQLAQIQSAALEIASQGTDLATARRLLTEATRLLIPGGDHREASYSDLITDFVLRQNDPTPPDYLDLGIDQLNKKVKLRPRKFVILGADSSVGKTAFALQLAHQIAESGKSVGFFSYETALEDAGDRMAANVGTIDLPQIKDKTVAPSALARIAPEADKDLPLRVIESSGYTIEDIRAKILADGLQVVFIDYLQLIPVKQRDRWQAVTQISMELHALTQQLGVTLFALSQVTLPEPDKKGWRRWINKTDLRESNQLQQDADVILLLDLSDPRDRSSDRVCIIAKNKDGEIGSFCLRFDAPHMRFAYVAAGEDHPYRKMMAYLRGIKKEDAAKAKASTPAQPEHVQVSFEDYPDDGQLPF